MNEYKIIILRERPELAPIAAEWFHCKWGVPTEAYLECIQDCKNRDDGTSICKTECRTFSWRAESAGARHSKEER